MSSSHTPPEAPALLLVAGPNGSGKSTISRSLAVGGSIEVIDPDAFAARLSPEAPSRAAIAGARAAITRSRSLLANRKSFILESTLSGSGAVALARRASEVGYQILLIYVSLREPELHVERVRLRVAQGGHDVPAPDIRRRYWRSMSRAPEVMRLANETLVLDNSGQGPEAMLMLRGGQVVWRAEVVPDWVRALASRLS